VAVEAGWPAKIIALSRSGDAFIAQLDGKVWWLDTGGGELTEVAPSAAAFLQLLEDPTTARHLLLAPVVEEFVRIHGPIPVGKCLGFTQLPILGGSYSLANRWLAPAVEHFGLTGDMHRQIRDLPDGKRVNMRIE
jgi:hypothetical protein